MGRGKTPPIVEELAREAHRAYLLPEGRALSETDPVVRAVQQAVDHVTEAFLQAARQELEEVLSADMVRLILGQIEEKTRRSLG